MFLRRYVQQASDSQLPSTSSLQGSLQHPRQSSNRSRFRITPHQRLATLFVAALLVAFGSGTTWVSRSHIPTARADANAPLTYTPKSLGVLPGDTDSGAGAINASGQIVGVSYTRAPFVMHPVYWPSPTSTTPLPLPTLPGDASTRVGNINDAGQIAGTGCDSDNSRCHGVYWAGPDPDGQPIPLQDPLPGTLPAQPVHTVANYISNTGQIIGETATADGNEYALFWPNYQATPLLLFSTGLDQQHSEAYGINDSKLIVGASTTTDGVGLPFWADASSGLIPPPTGLVPLWDSPFNGGGAGANAINVTGDIIGNSTSASSDPAISFYYNAVVWFHNQLQAPPTRLLPLPEDDFSFASSINNEQQAVGSSMPAATFPNGTRAVLWDLQDTAAAPLDLGILPGYTQSGAGSINDAGEIVGSSTTDYGIQSLATVWTTSAPNTAPVLGAISVSASPTPINAAVSATVSFTDANAQDTHTAAWDWGDGTTSQGTLTESNGSGSVQDTHTYSTAGVYMLRLTVTDQGGLSATATYQYEVVYDPTSTLRMTGKNKKDLVPSLANGDVLPGLTSSGQTDAADYGFTVEYKNGALDPHNDFIFTYTTGTNCGKPNAQNCHSLTLNATSVAWLIIDQTNNSRGQFQGVATVTVDGVTTANPFTVTGVDGDRLSPAGNDSLLLKVYAPGSDPATAMPIYQASGSMTKGNAVKIQ